MVKQSNTSGKSKAKPPTSKETYKVVVETTPTDDNDSTEEGTTENEDSPVVTTVDKQIKPAEQEKSSRVKSVLPKSSNKLATKKPKSRQASLAKYGKQPKTGGKSKTKRRPSTYKMVKTLPTDDSTEGKTTKEEEAMVPMVATVKQANSSDQSKSACVKLVGPKSCSKQAGKRPKSKERPKSKGKQRPKSKEHFVAEAKPKTKPRSLSAHKISSKKSVLSKTASNTKSTTTKTATKENNPTNVFILANPNDAQAMELIKQLLLKVNAPQEEPVADMPPVEWVTEKAQLEELYDAAYELHKKIKTVQESYQEIVRSLVNMQNRRPKGNSGLLTPSNTKTSGVTKSKATGVISSKEAPVPRILKSFMNPTTRDTAFRELFANVDTLKTTMAPFESCFDAAGYIDMNKYEANRVSTTNRDAWMVDIGSLDSLVGAILAEYNKEVLDMFRLESTSKQVGKPKSGQSKSKQGSSGMKMSKKRSIDLAGAKIGFVGAGKMTTAIVRGLTNFAQVKPKRIFVAAKTNRNLAQFKSLGVNVSTRAYDIFGQFDCDVVFLCMHGFVIRACFKGGGTRPLAFTVNYIPNQKHPLYVLSLVGGVSLEDIKLTLLDPEHPDKYMLYMHRVMLNIGIGYGLGMAVLDVEVDSNNCSPVVRDLLSALIQDKHVEHLPEQMMDTACIIGGNGLAFCYYFISAVADGGFKMGLNKIMSVRLAAKSLQIAAQSVIETGKHPSELRDSVTSQGGPAIYGINSLDKVDCAGGFQSAIEGAFRRLKLLLPH